MYWQAKLKQQFLRSTKIIAWKENESTRSSPAVTTGHHWQVQHPMLLWRVMNIYELGRGTTGVGNLACYKCKHWLQVAILGPVHIPWNGKVAVSRTVCHWNGWCTYVPNILSRAVRKVFPAQNPLMNLARSIMSEVNIICHSLGNEVAFRSIIVLIPATSE